MVCPGCGKELKDGMLFCEHCGEEIRIVSDFDPSDYSFSSGEMAEEVRKNLAEEQSTPEKEKDPLRRVMIWGTIGFLIVLILSVSVYLFHRYNDSYQYETAQRLIAEKNYANARHYAERAVQLEPENTDYLLAVLSCLTAEQDFETAKELCLQIIELDGTVQEAYRVLIALYEKEGLYQEINDLLAACSNEQIVSQYPAYLAKAPEFSEAPGVYDETFSLKLIANTKGTIYYTMDGTSPDESSEVYTSPIFLETGHYQIRAVFVSDYGVKSPEAEATYYVDLAAPEAPVVVPEPGEYTVPTLISVETEADCTVYYTVDGSAPTMDSSQYTGPFSMPVGTSTLRFISYSVAGVASGETEVSYSLNLHANLSIEAAKNKLLIELMQADVIQDLNGSVTTGSGHNVYNYRYVVTVEENDYYLYREYYEDDAGNSAATGTEYVVDVMDGQCYKAVQSQQAGEETDEEIMKNPWSSLTLQNISSVVSADN